MEYGQGLVGFQPELNMSDLIVDANSQAVDANARGGSTPTSGSGAGENLLETPGTKERWVDARKSTGDASIGDQFPETIETDNAPDEKTKGDATK
jgi:hypothetical protein